MPSPTNRIVIACAGAGKTTRLVTEAIADSNRRIAVVTYTNNNHRGIAEAFDRLNGGMPKHVRTFTWFSFMLQELVRPYQNLAFPGLEVNSICFLPTQSARYTSDGTRQHYVTGSGDIYSDKVAKFAVLSELSTKGRLFARLARLYTDVFLDEFQDLAGWDLELVELLLKSNVRVTMVGDPRQHIYSTNPSSKNKAYLGSGFLKRIAGWEKKGLCAVEWMNRTHRCTPEICTFVNGLWPGLPTIESARTDRTGHDGVFLVSSAAASQYVSQMRPVILRHSVASSVGAISEAAMNFGVSKGLQFDRVLILPTKAIAQYLKTGDLSHVEKARDRLHVAVTRAKHSVAFVYDGESPLPLPRWG